MTVHLGRIILGFTVLLATIGTSILMLQLVYTVGLRGILGLIVLAAICWMIGEAIIG